MTTRLNHNIMKAQLISAIMAACLIASCGTSKKMYDGSATTDQSEDVVNIGYGTTSRKNVSTAVDKLEVNQTVINSYDNITDYLRARVPGLEVDGNGKIKLRGEKSLLLHTEALIVFDEMIIDDISSIHPSDVYSVSVLKDASASVYGTRGSGGVILMTSVAAHNAQIAEQEAKKAQKAQEKLARLQAKENKKKDK